MPHSTIYAQHELRVVVTPYRTNPEAIATHADGLWKVVEKGHQNFKLSGKDSSVFNVLECKLAAPKRNRTVEIRDLINRHE